MRCVCVGVRACVRARVRACDNFDARYAYVWGGRQGDAFFETSGLLITFVLLGKYLEARARMQTTSSLACLVSLAPLTAVVLRGGDGGMGVDGGEEVEELVPAAAVGPGDLVLVRPGARVPVDGTVVSGRRCGARMAICIRACGLMHIQN